MFRSVKTLIISTSLCIFALFPQHTVAQQSDFRRIAQCFSALSDFDYRYPREAVYLHLDNNGYFEGETLWFKAYVVRASSLLPQPLSRVLYVELLDTDGELMERKLLRIDSLGQANGEFKLELPVRGGRFYEIRAFTREMLNWGDEACFSRVIPIFKKSNMDSEAPLEIQRPQSESDLNHGHLRPFNFTKKNTPTLNFYPEGGHRVAGLSGRMAFELTENGRPLADTVLIYNPDGTPLLATVPRHEGRGAFFLPAESTGAYAMVRGIRFELPEPNTAAGHALTATMESDLNILIQRRADARPELLGLAVMCRDQAVYFDTLTVGNHPVELQVGRKLLGDGVNRIELFDSHGRSLARRLVWGPPTARRVNMHVRQNEKEYAPHSPIVLEMHLSDAHHKPVGTTFSLSVREAASDVVTNPQTDFCTELLLCSELRGYVSNPQWYFIPHENNRRDALDDLLMVQGWAANRLEDMVRTDTLALSQPIEDRLTLQGRVLKNNEQQQAHAGVTISLRMFNKAGQSMQSEAVTDSLGDFTFGAGTDYMGDWIAQFSTRINGKNKWSRVALNRWFAPAPKTFHPKEMELISPVLTDDSAVKTFAWNDTLPRSSLTETIGTAVVRFKGWRGRSGNKYTYQGGEKAGMKRATTYYNIEQLVERNKDAGHTPNLIWDVLKEKDKAFDYFPDLDYDDRQYMQLLNAIGDTANGISTPEVYMFRYTGRPALIFVDNDLFKQLNKGDNPIIFADEVKSIVIMRDITQWRPLLPSNITNLSKLEALAPAAIFLYTRPDFTYFRTKKGIEKRTIHGYSIPAQFYSPDYRSIDPPTADDHRRTLYWNPAMQSDAAGNASALFFSNAHLGQHISISARGITARGGILHYETP